MELMSRKVSLLLSLIMLVPTLALAGFETDGVSVYNLVTGGQTVFQASKGTGVSQYVQSGGFNSVGGVVHERDIDFTTGTTLPYLTGVTDHVQKQLNNAISAITAFVISLNDSITQHTNPSAFKGVTDFAIDSQVSAFVIAQDQGVHSQVSSYVQSQVSQYPYNASVSAWIVDAKNQVNSQVTSYVQSQVSQYATIPNLALYTSYNQLHTVSGYAQDSQVSAFVIAQEQIVHGQVTSYVQNQVSAYPYGAQVTSWIASGTSPFASVTSWVANAVSDFPKNASVSAWIVDASQSVHSQVTSYVQSQVSQYPYASQVSSWFVSGASKFLLGNTGVADSSVSTWITDYTNRNAFAGVTDFALDSNVTAFVTTMLSRGAFSGMTEFALTSNVTAFVTSMLSAGAFTGATYFALQSVLSAQTAGSPWVKQSDYATALLKTAFVGVTGFALASELTSQTGGSPWVKQSDHAAALVKGAFIGTTAFALSSELAAQTANSPWVRQVDHANALLKAAFTGATWFALQSDLTSQTGGSPWVKQIDHANSLLRSAFTGATDFAVNSQVTAYVLAQITGVSNAQITGVSIVWTSIPGSGISGYALKYATGDTVFWAPDNSGSGSGGSTFTPVAYITGPTAAELRDALVTLTLMEAAPPPTARYIRFENTNVVWQDRNVIFEDRTIYEETTSETGVYVSKVGADSGSATNNSSAWLWLLGKQGLGTVGSGNTLTVTADGVHSQVSQWGTAAFTTPAMLAAAGAPETTTGVSLAPTVSGNHVWTGENEIALAQSGVSLVTVYTSKALTAKEAASTFVIVRTAIGGTPPTLQLSGTSPFITVLDRYGSGATLWTTGTLLYDSGSQFTTGNTLFWNSGVTGFQAQFAYIGSNEYVVTHNAPSNGTLLSGGTPFFK